MANLTGRLPQDSYGEILTINSGNNGVDATLRAIVSGDGGAANLKLSTVQTNVSGGSALLPALCFGDGDTGFYESTDDNLGFSTGGGLKMTLSDSGLKLNASNGAFIKRIAPTSTVPSIAPNQNDSDTGIGTNSLDQLSLIAGGVEGIRVTETSGNILTTIKGGLLKKRTDAGAADYNPSALTSDYLITANNTAAARAITISTEDVNSGSTSEPRYFLIKDEYGNAASNNLTITLESGGNIDGAASYVINSDYGWVLLYIDGTNAFVVG